MIPPAPGTAIIVALAVVGFAIASYFSAVAYRWMRPDARWVPPVCRMNSETCSLVVFTPQGNVFGRPNAVFGQVYYAGLGWAGASGWLFRDPVYSMALAASILTVLLAVYLSHALLVTLRVRCVLCFTSHGINVLILLLLLLSR